MQQHLQPPGAAGFPPIPSVTTEIVQKYLDENKQLILAILDNQNLGKFNECATFQAKLQANLMYLAAVADAQPQAPTVHPQSGAAPGLQSGAPYAAHPQVQQQMAQQQFMAGRSSVQYTTQQVSALHQAQQQLQQQAMHGQHGMNAMGNVNFQMNPTESGMTANNSLTSRGYMDLARGGISENMQGNRGLGTDMRLGSRPDIMLGSEAGGHPGGGNGNGAAVRHATDETGPSYFKVVEDNRT